MAGAPALLVWPWHYQPVAHSLNEVDGKRTEFEPSAWQAALIVIMAFADSLALNSLAPCAANAIYSRRWKLPYFTVLGWEVVEIYTTFIVLLFGGSNSLYTCCHIPFTFWQPCKAGTRRYYLMEQILFQLSWLPYSTYLYLDFYLCSMTKLKEHSREIC